jgi:acetyl esterase
LSCSGHERGAARAFIEFSARKSPQAQGSSFVTDRLDPQAKRFLDVLSLQGGPSVAELDLAARRAAFANLMRFTAPPAEIGDVEEIATTPPIRFYAPKQKSASALLFLHGGGLVAGNLATHDALCQTLTAASGCNLFAIDYRLAPEHPFPAALDDARGALKWIFEQSTHLGLKQIGIGGDSAGGTIAAVTAAEWNASEKPKLAFQFLLCPILDFAHATPSREAFASPILDQAILDHDIALYARGRSLDDPRLSPLRAATLANLPPTILHTAQCDPLRDEGAAYAARLREAGVDVHHTCHAGMPHLFYGLTSVVPAAREAVQQIGADLGGWLTRRSD